MKNPESATVTHNNLGIPCNTEVVAKLKARNPRWTLFSEWQILPLEEAIAYHLQGKDVIWAWASREELDRAIAEQKTGTWNNAKKKATDSKGRRTIDDQMIDSSEWVLLDVDKVSFNNTPQHIKDQAWLFYPSASVEAEVDGDVAKMHYLFKMPYPVKRDLVKRYRQIFLDKLCGDFDYDKSVVSPRWEFYGKNPVFSDQKYIKREDNRVIDVKTHVEIIEQIETENKAALKISSGKKSDVGESLIGKIDNYLMEETTLEAIAQGLFGLFRWSEKVSSHGTFEQLETKAEMFDPDAKSDNGLALYHSSKSGRILATHKGSERTISLYEFYVRYKLWVEGEECIECDVSDRLKGKGFVKLVNEICKELDVEPYKFEKKEGEKKGKDKTPVYDDFLPQYVKCLGDRTDKNIFYYWDYLDKYWGTTQSKETLISRCLSPVLEKETGKSFEELLPELETLARKIVPMKPIYSIKKPIKPDRDYVSFKNGTYRISTKELIEPSPDQKVFYRMDYDYAVVDSSINEKVEILLKKWANQHPTDWELVRDYFYASFLRMGQRWCAGMCFYGSPGSGKSMAVKALDLIEEGAVVSIKASNIISDRYPYSEFHEGVHGLYIDDITDMNAPSMGSLYEMLTENSKIQWQAKYANSIQIPRHATYAFTSEEFPVSLRSIKQGMKRRAFGVYLDWGLRKFPEIKDDMMAIFGNQNAMRQWFMWSLANVDQNALMERYNNFLYDESRVEILTSAIATDSPMVDFAEQHCVIAESEDDCVLRQDLIDRLKDYAHKKNDQYLTKLNDFRLLKQFISDVKVGHVRGQEMGAIQSSQQTSQHKPKQKRVDGVLKSVVWGVRLRSKDEVENIELTNESVEGQVLNGRVLNNGQMVIF